MPNPVPTAALMFCEWDWLGTILPRRSPATAAEHPETCYICGCFRVEGCFAPGVKITMADGSLRNIEDVRAGDMVRNAKTGAACEGG